MKSMFLKKQKMPFRSPLTRQPRNMADIETALRAVSI